ncbi:MAG: hypothetical protein NVS2B14_09710 [Chamaesiphon sp.]
MLDVEKGIMTQTTDTENRLDRIEQKLDKLSTDVEHLSTHVEHLSTDVEKSNDRFTNYQQAMQWVVQLAFTLIASATITVIVTAVLRR